MSWWNLKSKPALPSTPTLAIEQVNGEMVLIAKGPERCEVYTLDVIPIGEFRLVPGILVVGGGGGIEAWLRQFWEDLEAERRRRGGLHG